MAGELPANSTGRTSRKCRELIHGHKMPDSLYIGTSNDAVEKQCEND
jgi:hypothetical protein